MLNRISKITALVIITELCLGGGGRLIAFGPISLRMILFAVAMILTAAMIIEGKKIPKQYLKLIILYLVVIVIGVGVGLLNSSSSKLLWEDVKPLLYFLILPFFVLTVDSSEIISASKIYRVGPIVMAVAFFLSLLLIHFNWIPFLTFYAATIKSEEFFYRGELSFFYKGFLFLGVGSIFYFFSELKFKGFFISILIFCIVISVTRGLLFSLAITSFIYFFYQRRFLQAWSSIIVAVVIVVWGNTLTIHASRWIDSNRKGRTHEKSSGDLFGGRSYSDKSRFQQISEVAEQVSISSVVVGHGFGQGVDSRPIHMEISYLEIFHKQGLVGLLFWFVLAVMIYFGYQRSDKSYLANAFFYSALFVYVESITNQYFNNPIGMSVLLLSLVSLDKLKKEL